MISCGSSYTIALNNSGEIFSWGRGIFGTLGHGSLNDILKPTIIKINENIRIQLVSAGTGHTAAVSVAGKLYTWGTGSYG